ncbi:hypothetical protein BDK51DRAFT_48340 [Blyttiomyces helicus]|uniref:Uncharacterized protein n=1 Tax=Blyttiomyces helicus TaxID=388810 RepID=A0A4P9VYU5_9FUNG|nr:hypothetical protein BDK51DRAFT_48340 [Blyttiomyces helicus]|eukprot:RKO83498.1 hypothetical protein BDK51DRAFT_48340 [Blyttiomyces helicus]
MTCTVALGQDLYHGSGSRYELVKVVYVKLPAPLPSVLMISLLEIARLWEHHPEVSKCNHDATEDTNCQLPTVCTFATEKEVCDWCDCHRETDGSDAKIVVIRPQLPRKRKHPDRRHEQPLSPSHLWVLLWARQKEWKPQYNKIIADGITVHFLHFILFSVAFLHYRLYKAGNGSGSCNEPWLQVVTCTVALVHDLYRGSGSGPVSWLWIMTQANNL